MLQLLTLSVQPPDAWMIEAVAAKYDLDNIKMEQVRNTVHDKCMIEPICRWRRTSWLALH